LEDSGPCRALRLGPATTTLRGVGKAAWVSGLCKECMDKSLKDRFAKHIYKSLERQLKRTQDPIVLSEDIVDAVELIYDIVHEQEGIASVPTSLQGPTLDRAESSRVDTPPPPRGALVHKDVATDPGEAKPVILMPGDPGFSDTTPNEVERKVFSAGSGVRRRATSNPRKPSNLVETPKWDVSDLISLIDQNTPDTIEFTPDGMEGSKVVIVARKNIQNQVGMGSVLLTYKHAAVGDNTGGGAVEGKSVSLGLLTARVPFSVYDETQDIGNAIDGPKGITVQLRGMYKARPETMEPFLSGSAPRLGPGMAGVDPMGDSLEERLTPGLKSVSDPYASKGDDSILREHLLNLSRSNAGLVPSGKGSNSR